MRVAGLMSGTSLDGIDVAIVDITQRGGKPKLDLVAHGTTPYKKDLRQALLGVSNCATHTAEIARLNFLLGELYADAIEATCERSGVPLGSIELIGSHGQTIFHEGSPVQVLGRKVASTMQIGEASVVAARTGIPVVSDFRTLDVAAGGRGAPLVPFADYLLFTHPKRNRVALNIGGIANITILPAGAKPEQVLAFDTGPGNMVMDALTAELTGGRQTYDRGGKLAAKGQAQRELLDEALRDRYFRQKPPKTAGREQYGREFVERWRGSGVALVDLLATATAFTAESIAIGIRRFAGWEPDDLIASGGGIHNAVLMGHLRTLLPHANVVTTADFGIDPDAKEAAVFALLAYQNWRGQAGNLPSATGASRALPLGKQTRVRIR